MKIPFASFFSLRFLLGLGLVFTGALCTARADVDPQLGAQQVDQLLGPIALYPDALVAIILPASTFPDDIVQAQQYLSSGGSPDQIDYQPWDESVKALARYPTLIQWLDENMPWTQQLGSAFLNQPDSVMESVQRLRAQARANGTLTSTPQQKLVLDGDDIEIVPAQPDVIYVPYYDPNQVYGEPGYYGGPSYMTFGEGQPLGFWLSYDFNWRSHAIIVGDRHHNWAEHRDWNHGTGGKPNYGHNWHAWTPPANRPAAPRPDQHRPFAGVTQPRPYPRAPSSPAHGVQVQPQRPRPENNQPNQPENNRNRQAVPPNNPAWNQPGANQRAVPNAEPRPQPRPTLQPPSGPMTPPSANPRPDRENRDGREGPVPQRAVGNPPIPESNRLPPTRPPQVQPKAVPAPRPAAPPPPPKDAPRDDKPEPPR